MGEFLWIVALLVAFFGGLLAFILSWDSVDNKIPEDQRIFRRRLATGMFLCGTFLLFYNPIAAYVSSQKNAAHQKRSEKNQEKTLVKQDESLTKHDETHAKLDLVETKQDKSLGNEAAIKQDTEAILQRLGDLARSNESELQERFPFGYFVLGPNEKGFSHLPYEGTDGDVRAELKPKWRASDYHIKDGMAHIAYSGLGLTMRYGISYGRIGGMAGAADVPLKNGYVHYLGTIIMDNYDIAIEVLDADPKSPVFAMGVVVRKGGRVR
jgi:hypothetical protein